MDKQARHDYLQSIVDNGNVLLASEGDVKQCYVKLLSFSPRYPIAIAENLHHRKLLETFALEYQQSGEFHHCSVESVTTCILDTSEACKLYFSESIKDELAALSADLWTLELITISHVHPLIAHFHKSNQEFERLMNLQSWKHVSHQLHIKADVKTRWSSTYLTLKRTLTLKNEILTMQQNRTIQEYITTEDWMFIEILVELLQCCYDYQTVLEGDEYDTISLVPYVVSQTRKHIQKIVSFTNDNYPTNVVDAIRFGGKEMMSCFIERFGRETDPVVLESYRIVPGNIKQGISPLAIQAAALDPRTKELQGIPEREHENVELTRSKLVTDIQKEVQMYRSMNNIPFEVRSNSCLEWWKTHQNTFLYLSKLARKALAPPATSASPERMFSKGGMYLDKHRTNMKDDVFSSLITIQGTYEAAEAQVRKKKKLV